MMKKEYKILIIIGIVYFVFLLLYISKFGFNSSSTIELSKDHLASFDGDIPSGIVVETNNGFDGQFYYMMALNPTLEKIHDIGVHFFQRITYPILTIIFSFGIKSLYPATMLLINYFSVIISCYLLLLMLKKSRANLNLVYIFAFNVGFLVTIIRNLTEPLMVVFSVAAIYYLYEEKHLPSIIFFALAILTRELVLPLYAAVLLYFLINKKFKEAALYLTAIIPFLGWEFILFLKTNTIPLLMSFQSISRPIEGILNYFMKTQKNVEIYIKQPLLASTQNISSGSGVPLSTQSRGLTLNDFKLINKAFSPLPLAINSVVQSIMVVAIYIKNKKITKNSLFLFSQIALIFSLRGYFFLNLEIDSVGRYAILMFFFLVLFYAEEKENFGKYLKFLFAVCVILTITSSLLYFIQKIIFFHPTYYIT
jgi:hypothetical protein